MEREQFLADDRYDFTGGPVQPKVQAGDIAQQLPAQAFDIRYIPDQMEKLIGQIKLFSVRHGHEMTIMKREVFALNVSLVIPGVICDSRYVMQGGEFGVGLVLYLFVFVRDVNMHAQGKKLGDYGES